MTAETGESTQSLELLAWFIENWKKVAVGAGALLAAVGGYYLYNYLHAENEAAAAMALTELRSTADRASAAAVKPEDYRKIYSTYAGTEAARQAMFLAAGALYEAGQYEEARAEFDKFTREQTASSLAPQAALGIAASLEALKRPDEAMTAYQTVINRYPNDAVVTQAKLSLGRLYEAKGQPEAAYKLYQEMTRLAAMSAWQRDLSQRTDELLRRHPQLAATNPPATLVPAVPAVAPVPSQP